MKKHHNKMRALRKNHFAIYVATNISFGVSDHHDHIGNKDQVKTGAGIATSNKKKN